MKAASDASDQISRLRAQLSKADAIFREQREAWRFQSRSLDNSYQESIRISNKEYIDAVEGFEW